MNEVAKNKQDRWIPWCFVAFFAVVALVDSVFVYVAVSTHTGVVIEQPYEKGLAYNDVLAKAKAQPKLRDRLSYHDGVLRWQLSEMSGRPVSGAVVEARVIRPVQGGYDFDVALEHKGHGRYEAKVDLPFKGQWLAKLSGKWNNKQYQKTHKFMAE